MSEESPQDARDDRATYIDQVKRVEALYVELIQSNQQRAFEYGILAVRNLLLISGGALLAMPAFVGLSDQFPRQTAFQAGAWFAGSVVLTIVCMYLIHLNWSLIVVSLEISRDRDLGWIKRTYLPSQSDNTPSEEDFSRRLKRQDFFVALTYWLPHICGVVALAAFVTGTIVLYRGVQAVF